MTQGYQIRAFFRGLDTRHPGDCQHVAFFVAALLQQGQGCRLHGHHRARNRHALCDGLAADIHHTGGAGFVDMGESGQAGLR